MSTPNKVKGIERKLRQSVMGEFLSKKDNKKTSETFKVKEATPSINSKRKIIKGMFSWSRGAFRDTEEYRNCYPGKKDHESLDDNYRFYMNEIPSKPDGDLIDKIHVNWWGDYRLLERHHGYIQWLFPIRDTGMNWYAQELQLHEIKKLTADKKAMKRVLNSYKMMLDFYGMKLENEKNGKIVRADNWRDRFQHLNRSFHNYLRITRILKSLGELGFEHLKASFVKFILYEGLVEDTLENVLESCLKFWIGVLRTDQEREDVLEYYKELSESDNSDKKQRTRSPSPEAAEESKPKLKKKEVKKAKDKENEMSEDGTLEYAIDMINSDAENVEAGVIDSDKEDEDDIEGKGKKTKRKEHELSESDNEDDESQESRYWKQSEGEGQNEGEIEGTGESQRKDDVKDMSEGKNMSEDNGKREANMTKTDGTELSSLDLESTSDEVSEDVENKDNNKKEISTVLNDETIEANDSAEGTSGDQVGGSKNITEVIQEPSELIESKTELMETGEDKKQDSAVEKNEEGDEDKKEVINENSEMNDDIRNKDKDQEEVSSVFNGETMETNDSKEGNSSINQIGRVENKKAVIQETSELIESKTELMETCEDKKQDSAVEEVAMETDEDKLKLV